MDDKTFRSAQAQAKEEIKSQLATQEGVPPEEDVVGKMRDEDRKESVL